MLLIVLWRCWRSRGLKISKSIENVEILMIFDGEMEVGFVQDRWRALSERRLDSSVIVCQITGRLGLARRGCCQGAKPRNWTLVHPYRGLCVSDVVELDLSFLSIISSPSEWLGAEFCGLGRGSGACAAWGPLFAWRSAVAEHKPKVRSKAMPEACEYVRNSLFLVPSIDYATTMKPTSKSR